MVYTIVSDRGMDDDTENEIKGILLSSEDPEADLRERVERFERLDGDTVYIGAATRCVTKIEV